MPFSEPWFTKKSKLQVEQLLYNSFHVDGYFLVNPDYNKENNSVVALYLSVMCSDVLHQFKIVQVSTVFLRIVSTETIRGNTVPELF